MTQDHQWNRQDALSYLLKHMPYESALNRLKLKFSVFGGLSAEEFAKRLGPDGWEAVIDIFKRIYE